MKKIDKLVLSSFIGPFILTFLVVVFILLMQHMLRYFDDIIGKDLGFEVIGKLLFYFAIFMVPVAMPLAVLLSSLITFGNLGEHFELTAIKASGISLLRTLQPIFIFVIFLTIGAFYVNNNLVPKAALEAYSLLYDIKQKKPALELREGTFYNGLPEISIKVDKKFPDDESALKGIIVYDHRKRDGNKEVTKADSGRMYTILNERYLKFELFNGYNYTEGANEQREMTGQKGKAAETLTRSRFYKTEVVFDLSSFDMVTTDRKWFQGNRIMRNLSQLETDVDSMNEEILQQRLAHYMSQPTFFTYLNKDNRLYLPPEIEDFKAYQDSLERSKYVRDSSEQVVSVDTALTQKPAPKIKPKQKSSKYYRRHFSRKPTLSNYQSEVRTDTSVFKNNRAEIDSLFAVAPTRENLQNVSTLARQLMHNLVNSNTSVESYVKEQWVFEIQWHKILASSLACIAMFLIGAPLGAIIKKGGLGVPFLVSIFFFIVYYLLSMQGEKLAKQGAVSAASGIWAADIILFIIGLVFLKQARVDARLFDADSYRVALDRLKMRFAARKNYQPKPAS